MSEEITYAHLGHSGLLVSRIGLGTMNFDYTVGRTEQLRGHGRRNRRGHQLLRYRRRPRLPAVAEMKKGYGISEETVGRWLQRSGHRDDIVLATEGVPATALAARCVLAHRP